MIAPDRRTSQHEPSPSPGRGAPPAAPSIAGSVLGIATKAVNPPSAAARAPDSTVSASSRTRFAAMGVEVHEPGTRCKPAASRTRHAPGSGYPSPSSPTRSPPWMSTSARRASVDR